MRKSGWAAAGLGSLVLLLSACGGSGSSTSVASTSQSTSAGQSTSASASASSASASASASGSSSSNATTQPTPKPHNTAGPQPSSNLGSIPAIGTVLISIRNTTLGQVLVEASGYVVYTYTKDPKNGTPTCTGSCNTIWAPVIGVPQVTQGISIPGSLSVVTLSNGKKQITYNGKPLYTYKAAGPLLTSGNGVGGMWWVVKV